MPRSRVGGFGCAVRTGKPRWACIESAETTSPPSRSATASAAAVLPEAVGPKIATTLGADSGGAGLPANLCVLRKERVWRQRTVLFGVRRPVLLEPCDRARDAGLGRHAGLVIEELPRLRRIGDVMGHFADLSKARQLLDYEPSVPLEDGISRAVAWFKEHRAAHPEEDGPLPPDALFPQDAEIGWKPSSARVGS